MPQFRSTYPYRRYFPTLGIIVDPDEVIEQPENPDPNYFEEVGSSPTPPVVSTPAAPPVVSDPPTPEETI